MYFKQTKPFYASKGRTSNLPADWKIQIYLEAICAELGKEWGVDKVGRDWCGKNCGSLYCKGQEVFRIYSGKAKINVQTLTSTYITLSYTASLPRDPKKAAVRLQEMFAAWEKLAAKAKDEEKQIKLVMSQVGELNARIKELPQVMDIWVGKNLSDPESKYKFGFTFYIPTFEKAEILIQLLKDKNLTEEEENAETEQKATQAESH